MHISIFPHLLLSIQPCLCACPPLPVSTCPPPRLPVQGFGDYNEKTFGDVATVEEAFEWMSGPLSDGLFPDEMYNGLGVPPDKQGYVMSYNKVVGKVRLRQLRVRRDGCRLSQSVFQSGMLRDGTERRHSVLNARSWQRHSPLPTPASRG